MELTDIVTLIIRIITVIAVLVVFIELVYSFSVVVKTNELDKVSVELSENIMSSEYTIDGKKLTVSRAVFDEEALKAVEIENKYLEPARNCLFGAHYAFYDLEKNEKVAEFGFEEPVPEEKVDKKFPIGIRKRDEINGGYKIVPARMYMTIIDSGLSRITCAVETSWMTNDIESIGLKELEFFYGSNEELTRDDSSLTIISEHFRDRKRWIPSEIETVSSFQTSFDPDNYKLMESKGRLLFIPMRKQEFNTRGCVDWRENENRQYKPDQNDNRIICIKQVIK